MKYIVEIGTCEVKKEAHATTCSCSIDEASDVYEILLMTTYKDEAYEMFNKERKKLSCHISKNKVDKARFVMLEEFDEEEKEWNLVEFASDAYLQIGEYNNDDCAVEVSHKKYAPIEHVERTSTPLSYIKECITKDIRDGVNYSYYTLRLHGFLEYEFFYDNGELFSYKGGNSYGRAR